MAEKQTNKQEKVRNFRSELNTQVKYMSKQNPMKSYMWYFELPKFTRDMTDSYIRDISSRIFSVSLPNLQFETNKEMIGNSFMYYTNSVDIGNIVIEIYEMEDGKTREYLEIWKNLITGVSKLQRDQALSGFVTFNPPSFYKKNLHMYRFDDMKNEVYTDVYTDYFISGIEDITSDYESSDILKYNVTLTGDGIIHYDSSGNKDGMKGDATKKLSKYEQLANKVDNVADFMRKVTNARTGVRSIVDVLS